MVKAAGGEWSPRRRRTRRVGIGTGCAELRGFVWHTEASDPLMYFCLLREPFEIINPRADGSVKH